MSNSTSKMTLAIFNLHVESLKDAPGNGLLKESVTGMEPWDAAVEVGVALRTHFSKYRNLKQLPRVYERMKVKTHIQYLRIIISGCIYLINSYFI